ncbi:hypothetical protein C8R47DRAFT_259616 [Mycena vitilis]|nr:hypothetical protein C8R47DRAFT_259616 [Mycena vitilis]
MFTQSRYKPLKGKPEKATAVSAAHGSLPAFHSMSRFLPELGPDARWSLLPVLYANLDPTSIPSASDLDAAGSSFDHRCTLAYMSIQGLAYLIEYGRTKPSLDLARSLWPRIWKWIAFLHDYRDSIPILTSNPAVDIYSSYTSTTAWVFGYADDTIRTTPGITRILTHAWKLLLAVADHRAYAQVCTLVHILLKVTDTTTGTQELIEGAGGSHEDLAALVLRHMECATLTPHSNVSATTLANLFAASAPFLRFAFRVEHLSIALLSQGVIRAQVSALLSLLTVKLIQDEIDRVYLPQLLDWLELNPGYPNIRHALKAGLLRLLIRSGQVGASHVHLKELLVNILPQSTVYHSVLSQLEKSFLDVEELSTSPTFVTCDIFSYWTNFRDLAEQRIVSKQCYDSGRLQSTRVCHYPECWTATSELRCCAACKEAYYCSPFCQAQDWRSGGHRDSCKLLQLARQFGRDTLQKRDLSFLRWFVHDRYSGQRDQVLLWETASLSQHCPNSWAVIHDYSDREAAGWWRCLIGVVPELSRYFTATIIDANESRCTSEAVQGRVEFHAALIAQGRHRVAIPLPLHIRHHETRAELCRIGGELPAGTEPNDIEELFPVIYRRIQAQIAIPFEEFH